TGAGPAHRRGPRPRVPERRRPPRFADGVPRRRCRRGPTARIMGRVKPTTSTAHDPRPSGPPEWTPPSPLPAPPATPPGPGHPLPPPARPVLPVFYEPSDEAADDVLGQLLARRIVMLGGVLD